MVSFASNDYLGLSAHPAVVVAAQNALARWGAGSGASRLVTGSRPIHGELEPALAAWKGTEAAVCFPTGFRGQPRGAGARSGGPGVRVLSDELNHASIIDGCRLSRSSLAVYRHRDMGHLEELLTGAGPAGEGPARRRRRDADHRRHRFASSPWMGTPPRSAELVTLCQRHDALLVLDEAHAVLGPHLPGPRAGRGRGDGRPGPGRRSGGNGRAGRHAVKDIGLAGWLRGGIPRHRRPHGQPGPLLHLLHRASPADAAAALAALAVLRSARGPP